MSEKGDKLRQAAELADQELELVERQKEITEQMKKTWLKEQNISSHFDIEKKFAVEYQLSLSKARETLKTNIKKLKVEDNDVPSLIKQLRKYRRTLKGEEKNAITDSIDNLIKAYGEHLDETIENAYWISKYKPLVKEMTCNEDTLIKLSYVTEETVRRDMIDSLCKYWEAKLDRKDLSFNKEYAKLSKEMVASKKAFKKSLKNYMLGVSSKDVIKQEILKAVCEESGISSRQIHERLPTKLFKKTSPSIISKMAKTLNITNVNGAFYKIHDDIKKDIYSYTAAFIDSDGYITMDKNYNPRVGLIATGERGKAFMLEMHKSLGCGRLHLDQKSPQATRSVQRLNFYSGDDVVNILTKCRPHFKMKRANADILLELVRMKKSYKKQDWYAQRKEELFQLMKYENHKDHVGYDFSQYGIDPTTVAKLHGNSKMALMDKLDFENIKKEE